MEKGTPFWPSGQLKANREAIIDQGTGERRGLLVLREALREAQCLDWFLREDFLAEGTLEQ